jgi:hypothetical protein
MLSVYKEGTPRTSSGKHPEGGISSYLAALDNTDLRFREVASCSFTPLAPKRPFNEGPSVFFEQMSPPGMEKRSTGAVLPNVIKFPHYGPFRTPPEHPGYDPS